MTAPMMAAAGAMSDAALAKEVAELRALLGTQADQLKALNKRLGEAHPETMTPQLAKVLGNLLARIGAIHSGFTPSGAGAGVTASTNLQVNSLGVGAAADGTAGDVVLGANALVKRSDNQASFQLQGTGVTAFFGKGTFAPRNLAGVVVLVHGVAPAVDASLGCYFILSVATNIADVIQTPTNPPAAGIMQRITVDVRNTSGGALATAPAFSAGYKLLSALPVLANGQRYTISFVYDQAAALWVQDGAVSPAA